MVNTQSEKNFIISNLLRALLATMIFVGHVISWYDMKVEGRHHGVDFFGYLLFKNSQSYFYLALCHLSAAKFVILR